MLAISSIHFVVTGIQFWVSDYMILVLKQRYEKVVLVFGLVSITAPMFGVMLGGKLIERLGG